MAATGQRIVFVSTYPPIHCGVGEYLRLLAEAMLSVEPGLDLRVATLKEAGSEPYSLEGVLAYPVLERAAASYSPLLELLTEIGGADIVHVQHEFGIFGETEAIIDAVAEARRERLARATVITLHTVYHPMGLEKGKETRLRVNRAASMLDAVVVHSVLQEMELLSQGLPVEKVYRIPHGTSINTYIDVPRGVLAARLGLPKDLVEKRIVAVPGFLRRDKGLETLLKAFTRLRNGRDVRLVVAGEPQGRGAEEVARIVEEYASLDERIVYVRRYLSGQKVLMLAALADLIVLPYEDRPGKYSVSGILHLSMGSLKPIVGTRVPRLVELYQLAPRVTVKPYSPGSLAAKIKWVLDNYDDAVVYMERVYGYAVRTRWQRMARRHLELYRSLLASG